MIQHYRALFISDVHLGMHWSQADRLLDVLSGVRADTIYLVGDIIDFWRIRRGSAWPAPHTEVLRVLLQRARSGVRIVFLPGNHEDSLKAYVGTKFGEIEIERQVIHTTAGGRRYLVTHGDDYDIVARRAQWLAIVGDHAYGAALRLNKIGNAVWTRLGGSYWSISSYLKRKVKACVGRAGHFEEQLVAAADRFDAHGVICGHIHHPASRMIGEVHYVNIGDWVESCTIAVETRDGEIEILAWPSMTPASVHLPSSACAPGVGASI